MKTLGSLFISILILTQSGGYKVLVEIFSRARELDHVLQMAHQAIR